MYFTKVFSAYFCNISVSGRKVDDHLMSKSIHDVFKLVALATNVGLIKLTRMCFQSDAVSNT